MLSFSTSRLGFAGLLASLSLSAGSAQGAPPSRAWGARELPLLGGGAELPLPLRLSRGAREFSGRAVRGMTIGPIESRVQPGRGYGSPSFALTLRELEKRETNWISLTVFGRVSHKAGTGVSLELEAPFAETRENLRKSVAQAHARGQKVLLVPHIWVESGEWRAELEPKTPEDWKLWVKSYSRFVTTWAREAAADGVDLLAVGVELRFWVTNTHAQSFLPIIEQVRAVYPGPLTYAANWDDADDTLIWHRLDLLGINAFYPLHWEKNASTEQLVAGGERVRTQVEELARRFELPVLFTEFGYTARRDTAIEPWLWPEQLGTVTRDEQAQAQAYAALLAPMSRARGYLGQFVWRMYADIADLSQEPDWAFSPWDKRSLGVLTDAYAARLAWDLP